VRTRASLEQELQQLVQARTDELRYPVSTLDRRQWFERTGRRIADIRKELEEMEGPDDD
jgi:hypothetical protein